MCNVEGERVGREMVCGGGGEGHQITALLTSSAKKGLNLSSSSLLPW